MAFDLKKISPIDTKPGTGVGISLNFNNPGVFKITYTTQEAIKNNLNNFFLTNINERYLNPLFGGNLRNYLFEQIDKNNIDSLKEDIQYQLNLYFPNIVIKEFNIYSSDINENSINVFLKYNIVNTGLNDELTFQFQ